MTDQLYVHYRQQLVGTISLSVSGTMLFQYDDSWRKFSARFPVSLSLPLDRSFADTSSHHFFANLLPEGNVREQICKSLKISPNNDFELLKVIGGDCAGALTITPSIPSAADDLSPRFEPVTEFMLPTNTRRKAAPVSNNA